MEMGRGRGLGPSSRKGMRGKGRKVALSGSFQTRVVGRGG